jgi:nucleoside-diphosphate-sugar epimerase
MRVFVAGATGAVGRRLVPLLRALGHEVVAMTRDPAGLGALRAAGAEPVVADALDRDAIVCAVVAARPDAVVHQLTALAGVRSLRRFDRAFERTNRLRTEGTDNLVAAARAAGARRLVAQSYAGWPYAREGGPVKSEDDPLDPAPPAGMRRSLAAIRHLEAAVTGAPGVAGLALRLGNLYGPGTALAPGGELLEAIRRRRLPLVGSGAGIWSFVHVDDAAVATALALERGGPGVYNVVDDEPAPSASWLPELAAALGAPPPRRVPEWLGRILAGDAVTSMMTRTRGAANAKARRELGWRPRYPGLLDGLGLRRARTSRATTSSRAPRGAVTTPLPPC